MVQPRNATLGTAEAIWPLPVVMRPFAAGGAGDPELVLPGVAAGGVALVDRGQARSGEPGLLGVDRAGVGDLPAEVGQGHRVERLAPRLAPVG
jgi:hypothetical protein